MPKSDGPQPWGPSMEPPPDLLYAPAGEPLDGARRTAILDWTVNRYISLGWRVESRSPTQAVLVRGGDVNHVLHAILTIFTCLLWGVVWIVLALGNKKERVALTVDPNGSVQTVHGPG
ncbi:hypothetical protein [Streptomyces avidinii]|uniref:Uncharacterized protein n=1 Tax=Streptomyces avidinii TaxID=1895 RepID=A0ABS4KWS5_STRAV|nr:hypothetical protein [Streptomyces avidinii]MBP2034483.1 hypothetical protein [Streptomyces avidinii]GGY86576.1 hypothetical protein GCM10010343_09470 [Streptomyces avidinii]